MIKSVQLPSKNCKICPRLYGFRKENKKKFSGWHNAPVTPFGSLSSQLLIVGLAPGLRGANRTGRPFTGDYAGVLLFDTLLNYNFAIGSHENHADDNFELLDCRITNGVRCVPPQNKPIGSEVNGCRPFLKNEIDAMPNLKCILVLGVIAHNTVLRALNQKASLWKFQHNALHKLPNLPLLINSYHCSRYNTNTGRLTEKMFNDVFQSIRKFI